VSPLTSHVEVFYRAISAIIHVMYIKNELKINVLRIYQKHVQKRFPEHQCNVVDKKRNAESNSITNF